ncbi:UDP-glucosyltransferase 2-like [Drosophila sulfurigaster albostrigata]|uniref:UDP-glucosyltransferase 2-like n=1 Tax=Drosophila sulfurigaster albostrigata TaxID=89887 RepID=UPI002D2185B0|nr:UDP-glucosyltransferase 2-like [Drosophila sulfurigaster albostrigata]
MSSYAVFLTLLGAILLSGAQGANILGIFSCPSPSHLIIEMSMAKVLAENGHNVTVVTTLKPVVTHKNIKVIEVPLTDEEQNAWNKIMGSMIQTDNTDTGTALLRMRSQLKSMFDKNRDVMEDPQVTDLYENKDNKFDLVMIGYFMNNFQMGIAQKLKVPIVIATSMFQWGVFDSMLGNPADVAYVPAVNVHVNEHGLMDFKQRFSNFITSCFEKLFVYLIEKDNAEAYYYLYGNDSNMPPYEELNRNVSLVLFNSYAISEGPIRPNVPGVIEVGGIQIKDTPDPLPQEMSEFLNNATDGAILLSLGSNIQGKLLNPETVQKMFRVLSKLKQRVIWKWEDVNNTPGKSANILYSKWLPQDDILAHPKIVLFINHAGRGGITESQYHGKPMLSLPVFGDQPGNADKMVSDGFGLSMSLLALEEKPFRDNVIELLENPKYTQKVKAFSELFRDRPLTARQTVLYWTEYVLRHHGAPHLQSPLLRLNFVEAHNIDIYAVIIVALVVILFINKIVLQLLYRRLTRKSKKNTNAKKTN